MKSNVRFVAIWAAFVPVVLLLVALVPALDIDTWSSVQVTLVTAEVNALSAVVLAVVAYVWAKSVKEPAALQGTISAAAVATLALGAGFGWWSLSDVATQLVVLLVGAVLVLVLTILTRQTVSPVPPLPKSAVIVDPHPVTTMPAPEPVVSVLPLAAPAPLELADESGQASWLMVVLIVVVTLLVIAVFWGWRP